MAATRKPASKLRTGRTRKRPRRKLTEGAGRLVQREISNEDVLAVLAAGEVPQNSHRQCEQWLRSKLKLCWSLERAYASNRTKSAKIRRLSQFQKDLARVRGGMQDLTIPSQLIGARQLMQVLGKTNLGERKCEVIHQRAKKWGLRIRRELRLLDDILTYAIRLLENRPENADEKSAAKTTAKKSALKHLTEHIIIYWERQLRRTIDTGSTSYCVRFATAVYVLAGDPGASAHTSRERLRASRGKMRL